VSYVLFVISHKVAVYHFWLKKPIVLLKVAVKLHLLDNSLKMLIFVSVPVNIIFEGLALVVSVIQIEWR
jgi:type III secretory pathway component EscR